MIKRILNVVIKELEIIKEENSNKKTLSKSDAIKKIKFLEERLQQEKDKKLENHHRTYTTDYLKKKHIINKHDYYMWYWEVCFGTEEL